MTGIYRMMIACLERVSGWPPARASTWLPAALKRAAFVHDQENVRFRRPGTRRPQGQSSNHRNLPSLPSGRAQRAPRADFRSSAFRRDVAQPAFRRTPADLGEDLVGETDKTMAALARELSIDFDFAQIRVISTKGTGMMCALLSREARLTQAEIELIARRCQPLYERALAEAFATTNRKS
jgi:hypothetical protein